MTAHTLTIALVQMRSGRDMAANVATVGQMVREAAAAGAAYVQTPENTTVMDEDKARLLAQTPIEERSTALAAFRELARDLKLWLHIGSMPVAVGAGKIANRAFVIAPDGSLAARYDKIHLFDVDLAGGESYRESRTITPGSQAVVVDLPQARVGLGICYDLRFPQLFRALAKAGAGILTVPAAFTRKTGEKHWQTLLRARAIENGAFVLAAAQGGRHENGRETWGHSAVVDPDGVVVAEAGFEPCVLTTAIDLPQVEAYRAKIPSLTHDRGFTAPEVGAAAARSEAAE